MILNAKGGNIIIDGTSMNYISFGKGKEPLVMIPGLGDGLTTVKGMALPMALMYHMYAKEYKVYIFSRKDEFVEGYTTRDMAKDQAEAMKILGIAKANVLGISQGGMIAQFLAIDYPDLVEKLVLTVTSSRPNKTIKEVLTNWISHANQADYKKLQIDTAEKSYSVSYLKKYRLLYPLLGKVGKPKEFSRFIIQANSCIQHNSFDELKNIVCPTLVIGGSDDKIVGVDSSIELADKIQCSELFIYSGLGHALYEEAKDFHSRIMDFFGKY